MVRTLNPDISNCRETNIDSPNLLLMAVLGMVLDAIDVLIAFITSWYRADKRLLCVLLLRVCHHTEKAKIW